jgi:ferredoxin
VKIQADSKEIYGKHPIESITYHLCCELKQPSAEELYEIEPFRKRMQVLTVIVFALVALLTSAFVPRRSRVTVSPSTALFATPKEVIVQNLDTKQEVSIPAGSPLSLAAVRSGTRLSFQCKQGVCSSCETMLDGKRVRTCITKVPEKKKITLKKAKPL